MARKHPHGWLTQEIVRLTHDGFTAPRIAEKLGVTANLVRVIRFKKGLSRKYVPTEYRRHADASLDAPIRRGEFQDDLPISHTSCALSW